MNIKDVTLGKLAVAGLLFNSLTPYNNSLVNFRAATGDRIDLTIQEHRDALMKWLNDWGCRHLSKDQHQVASQSILDWYQTNCATLFNEKTPLWQLEDQESDRRVRSITTRTGPDLGAPYSGIEVRFAASGNKATRPKIAFTSRV